jgi:hypothetical protein
VEAWKLTHHFETFNSMHRSAAGREVASKMGLRRIKEESLCLKCHYTDQTDDSGKVVPISGISCESCHGPGKDWIKVHSASNEVNHLEKAKRLLPRCRQLFFLPHRAGGKAGQCGRPQSGERFRVGFLAFRRSAPQPSKIRRQSERRNPG